MMQKTIITIPALHLVGISARTNNFDEAIPAKAKIPSTIGKYFQHGIAEKIQHKKNRGITYCVYTDYESDVNGDYTYFIGEEVNAFDQNALEAHAELLQLHIPEQTYVKFTTEEGPMPLVCIQAWQKIWNMSVEELGGKRNCIADFEIYDQRASDPQRTILDIYIGIKK